MKNILIAFFALFIFCSGRSLLSQHIFYAGTIKEGKEILKMNDWEMTKIDSTKSGAEKVYIYHFKEMELK